MFKIRSYVKVLGVLFALGVVQAQDNFGPRSTTNPVFPNAQAEHYIHWVRSTYDALAQGLGDAARRRDDDALDAYDFLINQVNPIHIDANGLLMDEELKTAGKLDTSKKIWQRFTQTLNTSMRQADADGLDDEDKVALLASTYGYVGYGEALDDRGVAVEMPTFERTPGCMPSSQASGAPSACTYFYWDDDEGGRPLKVEEGKALREQGSQGIYIVSMGSQEVPVIAAFAPEQSRPLSAGSETEAGMDIEVIDLDQLVFEQSPRVENGVLKLNMASAMPGLLQASPSLATATVGLTASTSGALARMLAQQGGRAILVELILAGSGAAAGAESVLGVLTVGAAGAASIAGPLLVAGAGIVQIALAFKEAFDAMTSMYKEIRIAESVNKMKLMWMYAKGLLVYYTSNHLAQMTRTQLEGELDDVTQELGEMLDIVELIRAQADQEPPGQGPGPKRPYTKWEILGALLFGTGVTLGIENADAIQADIKRMTENSTHEIQELIARLRQLLNELENRKRSDEADDANHDRIPCSIAGLTSHPNIGVWMARENDQVRQVLNLQVERQLKIRALLRTWARGLKILKPVLKKAPSEKAFRSCSRILLAIVSSMATRSEQKDPDLLRFLPNIWAAIQPGLLTAESNQGLEWLSYMPSDSQRYQDSYEEHAFGDVFKLPGIDQDTVQYLERVIGLLETSFFLFDQTQLGTESFDVDDVLQNPKDPGTPQDHWTFSKIQALVNCYFDEEPRWEKCLEKLKTLLSSTQVPDYGSGVMTFYGLDETAYLLNQVSLLKRNPYLPSLFSHPEITSGLKFELAMLYNQGLHPKAHSMRAIYEPQEHRLTYFGKSTWDPSSNQRVKHKESKLAILALHGVAGEISDASTLEGWISIMGNTDMQSIGGVRRQIGENFMSADVTAIDLIGHGAGPNGDAYLQWDKIRSYFDPTFKRLKQSGKKIVVVARSGTPRFVLNYLAKRPHSIDALVFVSPSWTQQQRLPWRNSYLKDRVKTHDFFHRPHDPSAMTLQNLPSFLWYDSVSQQLEDWETRTFADVPVLIFTGEADEWMTTQERLFFRKMERQGVIDYHNLKGMRHNVFALEQSHEGAIDAYRKMYRFLQNNLRMSTR